MSLFARDKPPAFARPWMTEPAAAESVAARAGSDPLLERVGRELVDVGFSVVPRLIDPALCAQVVRDFGRFVESLGPDIEKYKDAQGRLLRLVNLHLWSDAARTVGLNPTIMRVLDFAFGLKAGIYTSLYFEYGTQQPIHRDSPFFETFPRNYFMGVWVALEDIDPASGPLMYVPGGHRFECDPHEIYRDVKLRDPKLSAPQAIGESLEIYYGRVAEQAARIAEPVTVALKAGDVAFWHPMTPHGGSPASNPALTRRSIVFHCAPEQLQVYQHDVFFSHHAPQPPAERYGFRRVGERAVALVGGTAFQLPG